jgi:hypothetical protein
MRLVRRVAISNFRSLRNVVLDDLAEYVPIIGLNGTGKSNVLRALSLFFNGYLDENGTPVDLSRDFPDFVRTKEKKRVQITVDFDLSSGYTVRDTATFLANSGISNELVVERSWSYAPGTTDTQSEIRFGPTRDDLRDADPSDIQALLTVIRSVEFRYVPNHVRPSDLIEEEIQPLRSTLLRRLQMTKAYKEAGVPAAMMALHKVAEDVFAPLSASVRAGAQQLSSIGADLPTNFTELAFQVGINAVSSTGSVQQPALQGSGTQSFLLLHVLALLDKASRGQMFGWRQSSVWALEEPESFLHAGLRTRFAEDVRRFASDERRQVFVTTHQDEFVRTGSAAWVATLSDGATVVERLTSRDALKKTNRLRVTSFGHPLLTLVDYPLVLVEGKWDSLYLRRAIATAGLRPRWRVVDMSDIDETYSGGTALANYLRVSALALASRPETSPVIVLRDWEETPADLAAIAAILSPHETSRAAKCDVAYANPQLGPTFVGIERYLETEFIRSVVPNADLRPESLDSPFPLWVHKTNLTAAKPRLAARFQADSTATSRYLEALVRSIDQIVEAALAQVSPTEFVAVAPPPDTT